MEEDGDYMEDDNFYPSDFEDDVSEMVGVEEFLQGVDIGNLGFQETHFLSSNGESDEDEEDVGEEIIEPWEEVLEEGVEHVNIGDSTPSSIFQDIPIETFPKYVHFNLQSLALMIDCIRGEYSPSYQQIHVENSLFCPLSNLHRPFTQKNVKSLTIERWQKLQGRLKVVELSSGFVLSPLNDTKGRQIPPIESWPSIVHRGHIDKNGKHLSFSMTLNAIRTQWSTDIYVGEIQSSFIQHCMNSCEVCQEKKLWDEVVKVPLENLSATLDALCTKYIVLRWRVKCHVWKTKTSTLYRCHHGHNKNRPHRRTVDVKPMDDKGSRRNRTSRLCGFKFQMKVEEPNVSNSSNTLPHGKLQATIYVHSKHSGHTPGFDSNLFFLPVHSYVIAWIMENLKFMLSPRAFEATFKTNQYGLPFYAAIVSNEDGIGIPVFYMFCSNDVREGHEGLVIETALSHIFGSLGEVTPFAIIIDKHKPSLNAIQRVVSNDVHYWTYKKGTKTQIGGQVLLCHFHAMKTWSENLLTKVLNEDKDRVWRALHVLMLCPSEDHFNENLTRFCIEFQYIPTFAKYVISGWARITCP
ncbi:hypothetical protein KC19_VG113700 [Ceratodon purpureus]|uniref:MULE transposase domain-containing protein n=1 Tax=Ceratodon purpureus TaxID=3225 RepID=A0A8T0HPC9_CERPU|nr:hypothetical protein KC19_VG113700 [Ceratodon purpureus]